MNASAIALGLLLASMWAVLCRIHQMQWRVTKLIVFVQHAAMLMGAAGGLVLPTEWARVSLAAGYLVFLLMSAKRWQGGAPKGTDLEGGKK